MHAAPRASRLGRTLPPANGSPDPALLERQSIAASACANCFAALNGEYCSQCGAARLDDRRITVRRFAGDLWNEITDLESTTLRTLRALLTKPGLLTTEFCRGRTRWYLSPVRLYLLTFGLMVFVQSFTTMDREIDQKIRHSVEISTTPNAAAPSAQRGGAKADSPDIRDVVGSAAQLALHNQWVHLADPFVLALFLLLLYRRGRQSYAEHVVFALHVLSFQWIATVAWFALKLASRSPMSSIDVLTLLSFLALGIYAYLAARRVHEESRMRASVKAVGFVVSAQLATLLVSGAIVLGSLARMSIMTSGAVRHG